MIFESDEVSPHPVEHPEWRYPPLPNMGHGIVWADVVAAIELDQRKRQDGTLDVDGYSLMLANQYVHNGRVEGYSE